MSSLVELLLQMRLVADTQGDERSLVAIAAEFERNASEILMPDYLRRSILQKSHQRNQMQKTKEDV